jgi:Mn2+/Fe2+ NRAMP family transporter
MPRSAKKNPLKRFFSILGPGLTTGAADNDPSGIATYSIAGAQLGTSLLWTAFVTWPLMGFVQLMCGRIGMVTGRGLACTLRQIWPRWLLFIAAAALLGANIITIGADLAGMSDAGQMLTGLNSQVFTVFFGAGITLAIIYFRYHQIAFVLKWLTLVLFAYVITAFVLKPNWGKVLYDTFIPSWPRDHNAWQSLVSCPRDYHKSIRFSGSPRRKSKRRKRWGDGC